MAVASAVELGVAFISIVPETSKIAPGVGKALGQTERQAEASGKRAGKRFGGGMGGAVAGLGKTVFAPLAAAAAGVGLVQFFGDAVKGASELEQSVGGVEAVFKGQAGAIKQAASEAAQNLGLSKNAYNELATVLGAGLKNQGIKDFAGETQNLIGIGGDLAAQYGGSTKDAVEALASAMRGESDPIEKYGISLNETAVNAELAAKGQDKLQGAALQQAKAMARIAIIQRQSADAQGAFGREADTLAGKQARLSASWENAKAVLGGLLLPVISRALDVVSGLGGAVTGVWASFQSGSAATSGLSAAFAAVAKSPIGAWLAGLGRTIAGVVQPAIREVAGIFTTQFLPALAPIGAALVAAGAAFARFVAAIIGSPLGQFVGVILKGAILGFVTGVKDMFVGLVRVVSGVFQTIAGLVTGDWGRVWDGLTTVVGGAVQALWGLLNVGLMGRVLGLFRGFGAILAQLFTGGGVLGGALRGFGSFAVGILTGIGRGFVEFGGTLGRIAGAVIGPAIRGVGAVFGTLKGLADTAIGAVVGVFTSLGAKIAGAMGSAGTAMSGFGASVTRVWSAITGAVMGAWNLIFGSVLTPMRATLIGVLVAAWNGFGASVSAVWSAVTGVTSRAWATVLGVFTVLRAWATVTLPAALAVFRATAAAVWAAVSAVMAAAWASILGRVFTPIRNWTTVIFPAAFRLFQAVVSAVWSSVTAVISAAWAVLLARVFTPIRTWLTATFVAALTVFRATVATIWNAVWATISTVWNFILTRVFTPIRTWLTNYFVTSLNGWQRIVTAVWGAARNAIFAAWNFILTRIFTPLKNWLGPIFSSALSTYRSTVETVWSTVTRTIANAWGRISGTFTNLKNGLQSVWQWFQTAVKGIGQTWDTMKKKVSDPVRFVVNTVIRDNLIRAWNAVAGKVGLGTFKFNGMYAGGTVRGWSPNDTADNIPAMLTADEEVIRRRSARKMRRKRPGVLEHINAYGDLPRGFRDGGTVADSERPGPQMGGRTSPLGRGEYQRDQGVWRQMKTWLNQHIPGARVTSSFRQTRTATGKISNHARGLALDIAGGGGTSMMSIFNTLAKTFGGRSLELIHSPAGGRQIHRGRPYMYTGSTRANHFDHVHWAMPSMDPNIKPDMSGGGSFPNPLNAFTKALMAPFFKGAKNLVGGMVGKLGDSTWVEMMKAGATLPIDQVEKWLTAQIDAKFAPMAGGVADAASAVARVASGPIQKMVQGLASQAGWGSGAQWKALSWIIGKESNWNARAQNPKSTAYGIGQFLNSTWATVGMRKTSDPQGQTMGMLKYIAQRYGDPLKAMAFWKRNGHYGDGGRVLEGAKLFDGGGMFEYGDIGLHKARKPDRVLTERQWDAVERYLPVRDQVLAGAGQGAVINVNGIKYDSVGEFADGLNYALARASNRSRY